MFPLAWHGPGISVYTAFLRQWQHEFLLIRRQRVAPPHVQWSAQHRCGHGKMLTSIWPRPCLLAEYVSGDQSEHHVVQVTGFLDGTLEPEKASHTPKVFLQSREHNFILLLPVWCCLHKVPHSPRRELCQEATGGIPIHLQSSSHFPCPYFIQY